MGAVSSVYFSTTSTSCRDFHASSISLPLVETSKDVSQKYSNVLVAGESFLRQILGDVATIGVARRGIGVEEVSLEVLYLKSLLRRLLERLKGMMV